MRATRRNRQVQPRRDPIDGERGMRRVLLVEDRPFVADPIASALLAPHDVAVGWCRDAQGEVTCDGFVNEQCPLHEQVELVLDVRAASASRLMGGELGVACAGVVGIPVVATGPTRPDKTDAPWAVATCSAEDASDFCRQLLDHPQVFEDQRVDDLVHRVLQMRGDEVGEVAVDVVRWPGSVAVVVRCEALPSSATCGAVDQAVREAWRTRTDGDHEVSLSFTTHYGSA